MLFVLNFPSRVRHVTGVQCSTAKKKMDPSSQTFSLPFSLFQSWGHRFTGSLCHEVYEDFLHDIRYLSAIAKNNKLQHYINRQFGRGTRATSFLFKSKIRKKQPANTKRFIEHFIGDPRWNLNILQPECRPCLWANNSEGFKQSFHPHFFWPKVWSLFRKRWDNENSMSVYLALNQQAQIIKRGCFSPTKRTRTATQHYRRCFKSRLISSIY